MRNGGCWLGVALILLCGPLPARAGEPWLAAHGKDPVDYIAGALEKHPIVLLGEGHWIRHDVELVASVVRRIGGVGFQVLALELLPASRQAVVDDLIASERWDRPRAISILRAQAWPYEEYLEILEAAWRVNRDGRSLRVVALGPGADWRETILPLGETYDDFMARRILEAAPGDAVRVLVYLGFNHAFTRYHQPDSWSARREVPPISGSAGLEGGRRDPESGTMPSGSPGRTPRGTELGARCEKRWLPAGRCPGPALRAAPGSSR